MVDSGRGSQLMIEVEEVDKEEDDDSDFEFSPSVPKITKCLIANDEMMQLDFLKYMFV